ncbi:hypothetical protein C8N28_1979 [Albibacterium bauzanense]|uniref:Uncharacterized protein n=1 Tax=Albibacterium bauzanense TaxID=653929 RepID=A0A4R1LVG3_9SPHI|nr:hypothetical protein C8N28_1979 [Albibacterium bauzanense]
MSLYKNAIERIAKIRHVSRNLLFVFSKLITFVKGNL